MVQLSTPGVTPNRGMGPPVRRFLSNYFDLLFLLTRLLNNGWMDFHQLFTKRRLCKVIC